MRKIGAHLSISGGYDKALDRILQIGGNALQIFSTSPRSWNKPILGSEVVSLFLNKKKALNIDPIYFHASYLINLADGNEIGIKSKESLISELTYASQLGIKGSVIHLGSFKSNENIILDVSQDRRYSTLISNILEVLSKTPKDTFFIIENAGNNKIGQSLEEIYAIIKDIQDERIRVCLDTCHLFSAGYDITNKKTICEFIEKINILFGIDRIELLHINDSKDQFQSGRDRHENIGKGTMGMSGINTFISVPQFLHLPLIIETPGFDNLGPDKQNLDLLKTMV